MAALSSSYYSITKCLYITTCCSDNPNNDNISKKQAQTRTRTRTPQLLKLAVGGATQILRLFSVSSTSSNKRMELVVPQGKEELSVSVVDDVMDILKADYVNAYFVTGIFSSSIYADDCLFEDPTIKFSGTDLYARNLQLLVPFFQQPSIVLKSIGKGTDAERDFVLANWSLRTYLKLPWRPLIAIEGSTVYELNDELKIVRHAESWNISALEAVGQIFSPGFGRSSD